MFSEQTVVVLNKFMRKKYLIFKKTLHIYDLIWNIFLRKHQRPQFLVSMT